MEPKLIKVNEQPLRKLDEGISLKILLDEEVGAKAIALGWMEFEPHTGTAEHVRDVEEVIYVTKGQATIHTASASYAMKAGDCIYIPPGVTHRHANDSDERANQLYLFVPPGPAPGLRDLKPMS